MNCKKIREITADYVSGCLPSATRRLYEDHIAGCDECADELNYMSAMIASLGRLGERRSPVDCWPSIRERIAREARPKPFIWNLFRPVLAAPIFAVFVLLVVLVVSGQLGQSPQSPESIPGYSVYLTAHARAQRVQAFSDPDVTFVAAELENASFDGSPARP